MAKKKSLIKWVFLLLVVLVLLIIVFVVSLTPADERRELADYVAEYNRISKPADFDPNENAVPYFDTAFELMVEAPDDLDTLRNIWPADMNDNQIQTVRQWVEANEKALDYLKQAISKPYYWRLLNVDKNDSLTMMDGADLRLSMQSAYLLCMEAKLMALDGQIEPATRQLIDVYNMGTFFAGPKTFIEQIVGRNIISGNAIRSAFQILDHTNPSPVILEDFQRQITSLSSNQPFLIDVAVERLRFYMSLDEMYADDGQRKFILFVKKSFLGALKRARAAREKRKADIMYDYLAEAAHKTPWQLHSEGSDINSVTEKIAEDTSLLRIYRSSVYESVIFGSYWNQVHTDALIAATAILRYKAEAGRYPQDLQQLVTAGYLEKLPMDPFSGSDLAYRVTGDNFELYSFAEDFDDDGGKHDQHWADKGDGDFVFWPVRKVN